MLAKHGPFAWLTINYSYDISTGIHKRISNYGIATLLEVIAQDDGITSGKSLYLGRRFPAHEAAPIVDRHIPAFLRHSVIFHNYH